MEEGRGKREEGRGGRGKGRERCVCMCMWEKGKDREVRARWLRVRVRVNSKHTRLTMLWWENVNIMSCCRRVLTRPQSPRNEIGASTTVRHLGWSHEAEEMKGIMV